MLSGVAAGVSKTAAVRNVYFQLFHVMNLNQPSDLMIFNVREPSEINPSG